MNSFEHTFKRCVLKKYLARYIYGLGFINYWNKKLKRDKLDKQNVISCLLFNTTTLIKCRTNPEQRCYEDHSQNIVYEIKTNFSKRNKRNLILDTKQSFQMHSQMVTFHEIAVNWYTNKPKHQTSP